MNAPVDISKELVTIPRENAMEIFTSTNGEQLEPFLKIIRDHIDAWEPPSLDTAKGRKEIASFAYKIAQSKTALEKVGEALAAEAKAIPKKIDASRKMVRDRLDAWRDEVRKPLDDWETAEAERIAKHEQRIAQIAAMSQATEGRTASDLKASLALVEQELVGAHWEEYEEEFARTKDRTIATLKAAIAARDKLDADQAELAELRRQAAERAAQESETARLKAAEEREARAAEQARLKAEASAKAEQERAAEQALAERQKIEADAQREREAAARRELELKLQVEAAARQALETEQRLKDEAAAAVRAAQETEARLKREAEDKAEFEAAATRAREADRTHRATINRAAFEALVKGGIPIDVAKEVIVLIATRQVPSVSISY
jgi:hypothetical protein